MKRLLCIGMVAAACLGLAACGGTSPHRDAGRDGSGPPDEGPDEGLVTPDVQDDADLTRDVVHPDALPTDEGVDGGELPPVDGVEAGADADVPTEEVCEGPACVPCPDDGLSCTREEHDPETGECVPVVVEDYCLIDGQCWFTLQPSPSNDCLFCVPSISTTAFSPNGDGLPCEDGNFCTFGDSCNATGKCVAGRPVDCNDDNPCSIDRCDPSIGCTYTNYNSTCDDHNACTYNDQCSNRTCVGTPISCSSTNPCITASCDPAVGCLKVPNTLPCNDSNLCTENDTCAGGTCVGTRITCDDGDSCTVDSCIDGMAVGCLHQPKGGISCDDEDACTTNDYCDWPAGQLAPTCKGYDRVCDDQNPCTLDTCDPVLGCLYTPYVPAVNPCFDLPCEVGMACVDGKCQGTPNACNDGNRCTLDSCDELFGCRHTGTTGACDDGNACTRGENCLTGTCRPPDGPEGVTDCDDHNECTTDDCLPSIGCAHTPRSGQCEDPDPCSLTGIGTCQNGTCASGILRDCDDFNGCTIDSCDLTGQCTHVADVGAPCTDGNACTSDSCDANGVCQSVANIGGECDDGNACTVGETCTTGGACGGGSTRQCDDANPCTSDSCDPKAGCLHASISGSCNDNSVCTTKDTCVNGKCVGKPITCNDNNFCTDDLCDPVSGCYYPPNDLGCDDGKPCTIDDLCVNSVCLGLSMFEEPSAKAGRIYISRYGNPGMGVDVDGLETTCQPKGYCVSGIDNAFGPLDWLFNPQIIAANAAGTLALLVEPELPDTAGAPFAVNLYWGQRTAPASCDPTTPGCNYGVEDDELQPVCEPIHSFDNAKLEGLKLTAGGKAYDLPIFLVFGSWRVPLTLKWAKMQISVATSNGHVTGGAGGLGGAVTMQSIRDGINAIPLDQFPPPYSRKTVLDYVDLFLKPDMDVDGDGTKESISMGWSVTLVTANITGYL